MDTLNRQRRDAVCRLSTQLSDIPGLTLLQEAAEDVEPSYYKVGLRYREADFAGLARDLFAESLRAEGIAVDPGFRSLHLIHASRRFRAADDLSEATLADVGMLTLHHPLLLEGHAAIDEVVTAIRKIHTHADEISKTLGTTER